MFKVGDIVRVAGGPLMTIRAFDPAGRAVCNWYQSGEGWVQQAFPVADLQTKYGGRRTNAPAVAAAGGTAWRSPDGPDTGYAGVILPAMTNRQVLTALLALGLAIEDVSGLTSWDDRRRVLVLRGLR